MDGDTFKFLKSFDNYSKYILDLINNDRLKKIDLDYADAMIKQIKVKAGQDIKYWENFKNRPTESEIEKIYDKYTSEFIGKTGSVDRRAVVDHQNLFWIKNKVQPILKKSGCKDTPQQILKQIKDLTSKY